MLLLLLTFLLHFLPPVPVLTGDAGTAMMWTELKLCTDPKEVFLHLKAGWWTGIPGRGDREQKCFWHVQSKGKMLKPHNLIRASTCLIFPQMCPFSLPLESHLGWCQEAQCQLCDSLATQEGRALLLREGQSEPRALQGWLCMDWQGMWRKSLQPQQQHLLPGSSKVPQVGRVLGQKGEEEGLGEWKHKRSEKSRGPDSHLRCWCGCVGGVLSSLSSTKALTSYLYQQQQLKSLLFRKYSMSHWVRLAGDL